MLDPKEIRALIEPLVTEVLETETAKLRASVLEQVLERSSLALQAAGNSRLEALSLAIAAVQQAGSQTGILQELLDGLARFGARVAVLLVRNDRATGWQSRGFVQADAVRRLNLDITSGAAAEMAASRTWVSVEAAAFDAEFLDIIGTPLSGQCVLLPLIVRERLAAVIYADAGQSGGSVESICMDVLVRSAGLWVEVVAMRKAIAGRNAAASAAVQAPAAAAPQAASSQAVAPAGVIPPAVAEVAPEPEEFAEQEITATTISDGGQVVAAPLRPVLAFTKASDPPAHSPNPMAIVPNPMSSAARHNAALRNEPDELRRKAQRFARLLIDEIRLYNENKVAEGRRERDVYGRLKDEIDRSRAIYDKRYAQTPVADEDYFNKELLENLAENDPTLLGSSFPR